MFHHRIFTYTVAAAFLVFGLIWQVGIPLAALAVGGSTPIDAASTGSTIVDFAPLVQMVIAVAWLGLMIVGAWLVFRHVKNQDARSAILNVLAAAASFGVNATKGALKDKPMTVDVASNVIATALRYAMAQAPQALAHFGFDEKTTARAILARLPGVEGEITDDTLNKIVSAATGTGPAGGFDIKALTEGVLAELATRNKPAAAAVPPAGTAPTPSTAAPKP